MTRSRRMLFTHTLVVLSFLYIPIAIVIIYSFNDSKMNAVWKGFTFKWYVSLFQNTRMMEALWNSLLIATLSTIIATIIGTMISLALNRSRSRLSGAVRNLLYLPILVPDIVMGLSLLVLFSELYMPLGKQTILIAHATFSISYVYVIVSARIEGLNKFMTEAAQDLGATPWQTFRFVTLPLILPGVVAGALISFTLSIDDFMITSFVSGPESTTLPLYIYGLVKKGVSPEVNALSTLMIVLTVVLVLIAEMVRGKNEHGKKRVLSY